MESPNLQLAKKLKIGAWIMTAIVLLLIVLMRRVKIDTGIDFTFLPAVYSTLNALVAIVLCFAIYFVKQKKIELHRRCINLAVVLSALFLLGYVIYHFTTEETRFGGEGSIRYVYFFLLITHVVLAAVIFPFIMFTYIRAYTAQIDKHRKMARWVFPLWLYVALTGPILFLMLSPYYS